MLTSTGIWLYRTNSESSHQLTEEDLSTAICACVGDGYIYSAHSDGTIRKTSITSPSKSEIINAQNWQATKCISYNPNGSLLIFCGSAFQMWIEDGTYKVALTEDWSETKQVNSIGKQGLAAVNCLWYINLDKLSYKRLLNAGGEWGTSKAIITLGTKFFVVREKIYGLDIAAGTATPISLTYEGTEDYSDLRGAVGANGYIYALWESGDLYKIKVPFMDD